jgi:DNA-binding beta-propeller fold protein YncE
LAAVIAVAHAAIPTNEARVLTAIGAGAGLSLPSDVAVAADGRVYVVDSGNHRIAVFDRDGKLLARFAERGTEPGKLRNPVGLGLAPNGEVYVADKDNRRIQVFDADGRFRRGFAVTSRGKPVAPVDVALDAAGKTVYVTGNSNHRVMAFTPEGRFVREWGGEGVNRGEFRYPATLTVGGDGRVYVVDILNTRVQAFEAGGRIYQVGGWGVLPGELFRPKGVAVDHAGRVYVSDSYLDVVQVYDSSYNFLHVVGSGGKPHRVTAAAGIAVDGGRLYVAEMLNNRVAVIELAP